MTRIDKAAVYVCLCGFANNDGSVREGERLRGSHPAVQHQPSFFILDGCTAEEYRQARQARFPDLPGGVITGLLTRDPTDPAWSGN